MTQPSNVESPAGSPRTPRVKVVGVRHAHRLVAVEPFEEGELLFPVDGVTTDHPSRHSIQIDDHAHVDVKHDVTRGGIVEPVETDEIDEMCLRHPWRFLNHSCDPNAVLRGRGFVALRPIDAGEDVTYNYHTTEFDMAVPFDCRCGHHQCIGRISGFAHLPLAEQTRLRPWLADHLRRRVDSALQFAPA